MRKLSRAALEQINVPHSEGGKNALSRRVGVVFAAAHTAALAKTMTKGTRQSRVEIRQGLGQRPRRGGIVSPPKAGWSEGEASPF